MTLKFSMFLLSCLKLSIPIARSMEFLWRLIDYYFYRVQLLQWKKASGGFLKKEYSLSFSYKLNKIKSTYPPYQRVDYSTHTYKGTASSTGSSADCVRTSSIISSFTYIKDINGLLQKDQHSTVQVLHIHTSVKTPDTDIHSTPRKIRAKRASTGLFLSDDE